MNDCAMHQVNVPAAADRPCVVRIGPGVYDTCTTDGLAQWKDIQIRGSHDAPLSGGVGWGAIRQSPPPPWWEPFEPGAKMSAVIVIVVLTAWLLSRLLRTERPGPDDDFEFDDEQWAVTPGHRGGSPP